MITDEVNEVVLKSSDSKPLIDYVNNVLETSIDGKTSIKELEATLYSEKKLTLHVR